MQIKKGLFLAVFLLVFTVSFVSADYLIDVKLDKQDYAVGENLTFNVLLLENNKPISKEVVVYFSDALDKKLIEIKVLSNEENSLFIGDDFPSGGWNVRAVYGDESVEARPFFIKEKSEVDFEIVGDELIITNKGNVPYRKQIQIIIGNDITTLNVNIKVGSSKELKLTAPDGNYDIKITDGENSFTKKNVGLVGTGEVIGAYDESLLSGGIIGGVDDLENEEKFFLSGKIPVSLVFVGAVFGLGILFFIERRVRKKRS